MLSQLQQGYPFIAIIPDWSKLAAHEKGHYAHAILAVGINTDSQIVYYDDPGTGSQQHLSVTNFQNAWQSGSDFPSS